jgi:hypothetical protein
MAKKEVKKICLANQEREVIAEEQTINKLDEDFYKPKWTNEEKAAFAPIDRKQENKDVVHFQKTGDIEVFEKLYQNRIPTLKIWARKYYYLSDSADDMFGELSFCFAKAAMKYDKNRGSFNTCLYTFFQNLIRNIRSGKKAKKRKPIGSDPNSISNCTLSLDYDYNSKDGGESTLKDILAEDLCEEGIVADKISFEETVNILSQRNTSVKGFLRKLGDGMTVSSLIKELKVKRGRLPISNAQSKRLNTRRKCNRIVSNIIEEKTGIGRFKLLDYKISPSGNLLYTIELHKTQEADLMMKTIRNLRKDKTHFLSVINGH